MLEEARLRLTQPPAGVSLAGAGAELGKICENFVRKAEKHPQHSYWFQLNDLGNRKRRKINATQKLKYQSVQFRTNRFRNSPLSYLTELLNNMK